jgi:Fic family protein
VEITEWLTFFIECVLEAQKDAQETFMFVVKKAKFWQKYANALNERQTKVLRRMLDEGTNGFKGGMTPRKYITIASCSKATATRDLSDLVTKGCFLRSEDEGRSTFYTLHFNEVPL